LNSWGEIIMRKFFSRIAEIIDNTDLADENEINYLIGMEMSSKTGLGKMLILFGGLITGIGIVCIIQGLFTAVNKANLWGLSPLPIMGIACLIVGIYLVRTDKRKSHISQKEIDQSLERIKK
jgi:hypothetical protein